MAFDIAGALGAGYSADEIAAHLKATPGAVEFDVSGALGAGYTASEVVDHLNPKKGALDLRDVPVLAPIQRGIVHTQKGVADLAGSTSARWRTSSPETERAAKPHRNTVTRRRAGLIPWSTRYAR